MTTVANGPDEGNNEGSANEAAASATAEPTAPPTNGEDMARQFGAAVATVANGAELLARELEPYARGVAALEQAIRPTVATVANFLERAQREADRVRGNASARRVAEAIEVQTAMQTLAMVGGPRGLRDLQQTREALEHAGMLRREPLARSARLSLDPPSPPIPPPAPPSRPARRARDRSTDKPRRKAAGEELRAVLADSPAKFLDTINALQSTGRDLSRVAGDKGLSAPELRAMIATAERRVADAARKRRKRARASADAAPPAPDTPRTSKRKTPSP